MKQSLLEKLKNKFPLIVEEEDGLARIGKIAFDPKAFLGRGCEGTVVYRYDLIEYSADIFTSYTIQWLIQGGNGAPRPPRPPTSPVLDAPLMQSIVN